MTNLSDLFPAGYDTSDADAIAADLEWAKIAYGPLGRLVGTANPPPSLLDNLVSWWELNEVNGTRYDAHGSNDLTDIATVTQATGVVGNAAQFTEANGEYLTKASGHGLGGGDRDWSYATWVYMDSTPTQSFAGCGNIDTAVASQIDWLIYYASSRFRFTTCDAGFDTCIANTFGAPSASTWYMLYMQYVSATNTMSVSVNDGTFDTLVAAGNRNNTGNQFGIGASISGASISTDGRIDNSAFWTYPLPASLITTFYNGGSGISYASAAP